MIALVKQFAAKERKFGLVWEEKPENVAILCETKLPVLNEVVERHIERRQNGKTLMPDDGSNLPTHLLIEGDNYHALSVLNYTHAGKIDVIYIDPPYNTGAKDWKYNNNYVDSEDAYRHSKWLSFMEKRLVLAKKLLKPTGTLICTIDKNEQANLGVLLRMIFPEMEIVCVTIIHNPGGIQGKNFSYTHEYAYFVHPQDGVYISTTERDDVPTTAFRDWGKPTSLRTAAKTQFYPIIVKDGVIVGFGDVPDDDYHPNSNEVRKDGTIAVYPIDERGVERKWRFGRSSVESIKDELVCKINQGAVSIFRNKKNFRRKTVWIDTKYNANIYGTKLLKGIIDTDFPYPKSLYAVKDCIDSIIHDKKSAVVLDFFAGSGTTGHAVLELNASDGGNRQFILCTNNENGIAENVTCPRIKKVIDGYGGKEGIPAELRYFRTEFVEKDENEVTDAVRHELVERATDMLKIRENTFTLVEESRRRRRRQFEIYTNVAKTKYTAVIYDTTAIEAVKKKIVGKAVSIYIFTLGDDTYESDFDDPNWRVEPLPERILQVYKRLFAKRGKGTA